ncbi:MAG: APC family permease [Verrucomicrobiales bacterium]|jgi:APA family basic amino acid/polyamine antiporter|nr:APC family permease [Verrucomicrobiales bacterium]MBP9224183.1 APC family permease [Verrucomicrobiales bacterium]
MNDSSKTVVPGIAKVGLATAIAIVVANMIGVGVFGSLGFQVAGIPSGFPIMLLWLIGGLVSFCGAVCYAELASMFPKSGGEYHLLSRSWNPFIGFLAGWLSVTVGFAAPVAANASLLGGYLGEITGKAPAWFSIPVVLLITLIHLGKLSNIGLFQSGFTYAKVALILVLGGLGFLIGTAQPISFLPVEGDGDLIASSSFAISLVYVLYAYTGWNAATYMMDEVKHPEKTVPLALLIGTLIVTVLYLFINAAFLYSTPIPDMAGKPEVGLVAAQSILGPRGGIIMGILISFGLISTISSMTWAGPRVTAAIGRDHRHFRFLSRRNQNGVPALAVIIQAIIVIFLVYRATFSQLIHYVQALLTISSLMVVIGLILLRIRHPEMPRPYRAWGYPITPLIFAGVSLYVLRFQILEMPREFCYGLATLAVGAVVYLLFARRGVEANQKDS